MTIASALPGARPDRSIRPRHGRQLGTGNPAVLPSLDKAMTSRGRGAARIIGKRPDVAVAVPMRLVRARLSSAPFRLL